MTNSKKAVPLAKLYLITSLLLLTNAMNAQLLPKNSLIRFLALGDSYTIGEGVAEDQRWPVQLTARLSEKGYVSATPDIIATTGWRTDQLKDALLKKKPSGEYGLVSLLIGVNNQYQGKSLDEYETGFTELLDLAIQYAHDDKRRVFVLSIPDYGYTPFGQGRQGEISRDINLFNEVNKRLTRQRGVTYIDITDISRRGLLEPDLVAGDGLHPSGKMYALWVERIMQFFPEK